MIRRRLRLPTLPLAMFALLAAAAGPAAAQSACGAYYTVRTGDSLVEVAERCGVTVPALLAANPGVVDQRDLEVGGRLSVPDPASPQPAPIEACGAYYTVRTGDTVAEIAEKCGLPIPLLVAANGPLPDPLGIHDGMKIRIPPLPRDAVDDPATVAAPSRPAPPTTAGDAAGAADAAKAAGAAKAADAGETAGAEAAGEADAAAAAANGAAGHAADSAAVATEPGGGEELRQIEGTLEEGPRCLTVRTASGDRVAITGGTDVSIAVGSPVVLLGVETDDSACEVQPALELRILYRQRR